MWYVRRERFLAPRQVKETRSALCLNFQRSSTFRLHILVYETAKHCILHGRSSASIDLLHGNHGLDTKISRASERKLGSLVGNVLTAVGLVTVPRKRWHKW